MELPTLPNNVSGARLGSSLRQHSLIPTSHPNMSTPKVTPGSCTPGPHVLALQLQSHIHVFTPGVAPTAWGFPTQPRQIPSAPKDCHPPRLYIPSVQHVKVP